MKPAVRTSDVLLGIAILVATAPASRGSVVPEFNRDVRPILFGHCVACHGPDEHERKAGLRLDLEAAAKAELKDGGRAIVPASRAESELWRRVTSTDPDEVMPPPKAGHALKPAQIEMLGRWIDAGARYDGHWAFKKPVRPATPAGASAIDHFVRQRLAAEGLKHSPEADPVTLARRLFLDLTGLPPTPEEVDDFMRACRGSEGAGSGTARREAAVESLVDRLLASPAFGERWARMWLDLARYADSRGYGSDPLRLNIWRYRDWVIEAFNRNLPYDRFTIEQLAGDLLPDPTTEELLATAFHRNTLTNTLGGTIDEEFRVVAVKDRAETTAQVWMGLTMKCAQCHTHKFDPITNDEYYQFYAIFNQSEDNDLPDEFPTLPVPGFDDRRRIEALKARIAARKSELENPDREFLARQAEWEESVRHPERSWQPVELVRAMTRDGTPLERQPDGSLKLKLPASERDVVTVEAAPRGTVTALRIEALDDDALPSRGPGTAADGSFVLNEIKVFERPIESAPTRGRFVRIELPGDGRMIHIAEVQVISAGENIATRGTATQSSIDYGGVPERAIDGKTSGEFEGNSVTHTRMERDPWWEVDLGSEQPIEEIIIWNRTDSGLEKRLDGYAVRILGGQREERFAVKPPGVPQPSRSLAADGRRELPVRAASASSEHEKFPAARVIDGDTGPQNGWSAVGGRAQSLVLEFSDPFRPATAGSVLSAHLTHQRASKAMGRFRLSTTASPPPVRALPESIATLVAKPAGERTPDEAAQVLRFYASLDPATDAKAKAIAQLEKELAAVKTPDAPVMRELREGKRRITRTMVKGNYLSPGHEVTSAVPAAFHPLTGEMKRNPSGGIDRLALARWLVSRENPLTARVAVNRFWSQLFGRGIVFTEEDFGTQGTFPSHPELLDWLAVDFMETRWDVKRLIKTIVLSETYRQSGDMRGDLLEKDPQNVLLSRGPRFRLEAEMVRDQALAVSGLLSRTMGGPSVYPPQPDGLWRAAFNGERSYPTSTGDDRYRRGLYVFIRRTVPYPSLMTFDAPNREICTVRRVRTNTPLQAFVTLNDPAFVEMAQAFARRIHREGGQSPEDRLRFAIRQSTFREAPPEKLAILLTLYQNELARYRDNPGEARKLAEDPLHPLPPGTDWSEMAALTVVANTLLNLDLMMMKG